MLIMSASLYPWLTRRTKPSAESRGGTGLHAAHAGSRNRQESYILELAVYSSISSEYILWTINSKRCSLSREFSGQISVRILNVMLHSDTIHRRIFEKPGVKEICTTLLNLAFLRLIWPHKNILFFEQRILLQAYGACIDSIICCIYTFLLSSGILVLAGHVAA